MAKNSIKNQEYKNIKEIIIGYLEKSIKYMFLLLLSLVSTSLLLAIYFIKSSYWLVHIKEDWDIVTNVIIYMSIPVLSSYLVLFILRKYFSCDSIKNNVTEVKSVDNEYLPVYLGYIFISVSIPNSAPGVIDPLALWVVYGLINIVISSSSTLCFNPVFLVLGYTYYSVKTQANVRVFVLTRREIAKNAAVSFPQLKKITETIYIEV